jgi:peptidyl-prolyl cis-trans isomerase B (cyclophilin B)
MTIDPNKPYLARLRTNLGDITILLDPKDAPVTVNNFVFLARDGFYDGTTFHRVIPDFVIQGGDPNGDGKGGPGYSFADEPVKGSYEVGSVAMANAGPNTNGSQFFITEVPTPHLNRGHTIFGEVVKGFELVPKIARAGNGQVTLQHVEIVRSEKVP